MSLRFSFANVAPDSRALFINADDTFTALGEVIPFMAMVVGMGSITSKNAAEFYARVSIVERLNGAFRKRSTKTSHASWNLTCVEVMSAVGFTCNVALESRAAFLRRFVGNMLDDKTRQYWKERRAEHPGAPFHASEAGHA